MILATAIVFNGIHGWLLLIGALLFAVAAVIAWLSPRNLWGLLVAAGLCLWVLTGIVH